MERKSMISQQTFSMNKSMSDSSGDENEPASPSKKKRESRIPKPKKINYNQLKINETLSTHIDRQYLL